MSLIGAAVRSSAVGVIAGVLVFAVPIQSQALVPAPLVPALIATIAGAGGEGVAAAGAGAVCATGVGCAVLGVAAVGMGLYMTQDTWVPWVTNAFGGGSASSTPGSGGGVYPMALAFAHEITAPNVRIDINYNSTQSACGGGCGDNYSVQGELSCQNPAGGSVVTRALSGNVGFVPRATTGTVYSAGNGLTWGCGTADYTGSSGGPGSTVKAFWITWTAPQSGDVSNRLEYGGSFDVAAAGVQARVSCENPDGSTYEVVGTQLVDGLVEMPTCVGKAGSQAGAHGKCVTLLAGGPGAALDLQSSTCAAAQALRQEYPGCVGPGVSACTYVVRVDGIPCTVGAAACVDWTRTNLEDPSRVSCRWGSYVVATSMCALLERVYEVHTDPLTATELNVDGKPSTYDAPGPQGQTQPQTVPDPAPAPPVPQPAPAPDQTPGTIGSPNGPASAQERECWPSGWGLFNPASWVMQPVRCALVWAFVPDAATLTALRGGVQTDLARTGIPALGSAVAGPLTSIPGGSGCAGPEVVFAVPGYDFPVHPFSACAEPLATAALMSHALFTVVIVVGGGLGLLRLVGAGFGFNVGFRGGGSE